jgi:aminopeptidase
MADPRVEKLAKLVVKYSVAVKKGDEVMIAGAAEAAPFIRELYREVVKAGGYPLVLAGIDGIGNIFYENASDDQIKHVSPFKKFLYEKADAMIGISFDTNTRSMTAIPPEKVRMGSVASAGLMKTMMERTASGDFRWVAVPYPGNADAQEGSMSLSDYERFVFSSCLADRADPIAEWKKVSKMQQKMVDRLDRVKELRFVGLDTDLEMSVAGRKWINCDGQINLPDGEVFTGPVEDSVNGTIRFTYPGIYMGREIEDIRLTFKDGKVVKSSAAKGEDLLKTLLKADKGSTTLGEVAIGTNPGIAKFTKNMLFDEKMGGTVHMALGACYPETGAKNDSAIHWDILKDMKTGGRIFADGKLIYRDGKYLG